MEETLEVLNLLQKGKCYIHHVIEVLWTKSFSTICYMFYTSHPTFNDPRIWKTFTHPTVSNNDLITLAIHRGVNKLQCPSTCSFPHFFVTFSHLGPNIFIKQKPELQMAGHTFQYLCHHQIFRTLSNLNTADKNPLVSKTGI